MKTREDAIASAVGLVEKVIDDATDQEDLSDEEYVEFLIRIRNSCTARAASLGAFDQLRD